jgi:FkbM family methyltransferase
MNKKHPIRRWLERVAWHAPPRIQHALRKYHFMRQAAHGTLASNEPEYAMLPALLAPGSWVIDVGANVGLYTLRMSQLVGDTGRVVAFEPIGSTFEILAANCQVARCRNVSLINAAASDRAAIVSMAVPQLENGSPNFYQAQITPGGSGEQRALAISIDSLELPGRVALAKIDAEGHDAAVLHGMARLLKRDRPVLIVESSDETLCAWLSRFGYVRHKEPRSSNVVYRAPPL